ncbi:hypothetical protein [Parasitella parasitica]|uniref:Tc1-like transposase DDE domain-containing protein n=1 Tax=Parasitella parasitica TaxID=35722 RepID=A0A0B7NDQ1_9FUNG|nr:hypothetical protein [Parasitella parasitica]
MDWERPTAINAEQKKMLEYEHLSIREAAIKVGLSKSTTAHKIKEWNEKTNNSDQGGVSAKEYKGRGLILKGVHTVFISQQTSLDSRSCINFAEISRKFKLPKISSDSSKKGVVLLINALSRNISHETCEVGTPCKIKVETKEPNVSILGAAAGKRQRTDDTPGVKRKGTTGNDFLEFIEQFLTTIDAAGMKYEYLVLDNASIHRANLVRD